MSSKLFLNRLPSTWRLGILQATIVGTTIALCLTLAGSALKSDLEANARRVILDDLREYSLLYRKLGKEGVEELIDSGQISGALAVRVMTPDGKLISEREQQQSANPFPWPDQLHVRKLADVVDLVAVEHPQGAPHQLVGRIVLHDGNILWYGRSDAADVAYVEHIHFYLWMAGIAAAIISLVPIFWYASEVMRPVRSMIDSAKALARGAGDSRLTATSAVPELRDFADAFNIALDRNSALANELQAANDHLAHELRTPLARIRGNLASFHEEVHNPDASEAAARGLDEIDRATHLIQTILNVRAGEHKALRLHLEKTSVRSLLGGIADIYALSAEDRGLLLRMEAETDIELFIDQQLVTQAVANLLDNALSYSPSGGSVVLRLETTADRATIHVLDTGPGLNMDELETVWQRFIRGSAASARTPGMGLGLSLVRAIATAHGGSAGCRNRSGGGADFWFTLTQQSEPPV
jgi:signal transduction histidine kinase